MIVCIEEVLPFPQRNATGVIPPAEDAVHVMLEVDGTPAHEVVNAEAALTATNENIHATLAMETPIFCNVIFLTFLLTL